MAATAVASETAPLCAPEDGLLVPPSRLRRNNYDLLRLLLALSVIWSHSVPILYGRGAEEPLSALLPGSDLGKLAVGGFFAISGFLIAASWCASSPRAYLVKRVRRIYPGYVVAFFLSCAVAVLLSGHAAETAGRADWPRLAWRAITLRDPVMPGVYQGTSFPGVVNGALWSIEYEFACYIAVMLLGFAGVLRRPRVAAAMFAFSVALGWAVNRNPGSPVVLAHATRLWSFYMAGVLVYCWRDRLPRTRWRIAAAAAAALALPQAEPSLVHIALPTAGVYLLFAAAYARRVWFPAVTRFGDMSYGAYLYGWPVQQALVAAFGAGSLSTMSLALPSMAGALLAGALSYNLVERPFLAAASHARAVRS